MNETGIDPRVAFTTFRHKQQRRPSNLLECMDKDGNVDAFRYIEYSRQRRMEFLKRADFICKMKSTLRMQQNQQHQIHRSASLPGMKSLPIFPVSPPAPVVSPELLSKSMGRRHSINTIGTLGAPDALRFMARSASMPFVSSLSSCAATTRHRQVSNTITTTSPSTSTTSSTSAPNHQQNASFESLSATQPKRRSLRKEEFEAAEALLFGMGRRPSMVGSDKKSDKEEGEIDTDASPHSSKKRKRADLPLRTEEIGSVLSVVSTEEDASNNGNGNNNINSNSNIVQEEVIRL